MTFQIVLLLVCSFSLSLAGVISHTTVYKPQSKFSYGIDHGHQRYRPVKSSFSPWHNTQGIGFESTGKVGPSALGIEPKGDYLESRAYSTVSKREKNGAWSHVNVRIGQRHVPTSYSLFNLYSTK